jgi:hypothetical protein
MSDLENYSLVAPTPVDIKDRFNQALDIWQWRNKHIDRVDMYIEGRNVIPTPEELQYIIRVTRTYYLQAIVNEKGARFLLNPILQCVPAGESTTARAASTKLENALNAICRWMEVRGDGDVWSRVVLDAIKYDQGVERIECAPAAFWPEFSVAADGKEKLYGHYREKVNFTKPLEQDEKEYKKFREAYKAEQGIPIRTVHVPLKNFYPIYEGYTPVEVFETERRSLRQVLGQPLFSAEGIARLNGVVTGSGMTSKNIIDTQVTILHYDNQVYHAYYALAPTIQRSIVSGQKWPTGEHGSDGTIDKIGEPILLHAYPHNLGRTIYNPVGGRHGGWKTDHNQIESTMDALCELQQLLDEMATSSATNIKQFGMPTMVEEHDPQMRDIGNGIPTPTKVKPGSAIAIWKGEKVAPLFPNTDNPNLKWQVDQAINQMERLSGSAAIYGQQDPGVRTGYHANLQISQSEHLDEKLESHLAMGAVNRGYIIFGHIREMNETLPVHHRHTDKSGKKIGEYISINPKQLNPMPELDATVRKPRPIDYDAALRAAVTASQDRGGPGTPLLDDDTIRERILGEDAPDSIETKVAIQNERRKLLASGVLSAEIGKQLGLELARRAAPDVSEQQVASADPALLEALAGINADGTAAGAGGINPGLANKLLGGSTAAGVPQIGQEGGGPPPPSPANIIPAGPIPGQQAPSSINGQGGGTAPGTGQPEQVIAKAVQQAAMRR